MRPRRLEPNVAEVYHLHSSNVRSRLPDLDLDLSARPTQFRSFPAVPRVSLPRAELDLSMALGEALARRASVREFADLPLPLTSLSKLLALTYGVRGEHKDEGAWVLDRPVPSAGGLYPIEVYLAVSNVTDLVDGIYHYDPRGHELEVLATGNVQESVGALTIGQEMVAKANVLFVLAGHLERTMWKYGQRGYRYVWLDAGHLGQNLYLAATAMGLAVVGVGGFYDAELATLLGLPNEERPLYMICVGNRSGPEPSRRSTESA